MRWHVLFVVLALVTLTGGAALAQSDSATNPSPPGPGPGPGQNCPENEQAVATPGIPPPIPARIEGPAGVVALTFDAGADRGYAEDILDTLAEAGIPATFGMTGNWALANPELVQRMAADGHMVINHTLDHRSFTGISDRLGGLSAEWRQYELVQADEIIAPLIGHTTCPWYRLPYGDGDRRVGSDVVDVGYTQQVGWTIDTLGWRGSPVQSIVARSLRLAAPNAVYVMHVGSQSRDGPALPAIIEGLQAMGYGFATVANLDCD
ncbi:MAG TPA: polysaccharide deacetylase family protein [Chloroflexota bacterium]|nr:polysaccharide deacetylase family protein [Chloroflexota bacterium]